MSLIFEVIFDDDDEYLDRERRFLPRVDGFNFYEDLAFKRRYRLSKEAAFSVLQQIDHLLEYPTNKNKAVSPANQLLLALRYYASSSFSLALGDCCGVSRATANRIIHRVSKAICSLIGNYIKFPSTDEEIHRTQLLNYEVARFPKVVGIIDCTHIRILSPGGNDAEIFRNRKGYFSLNVQIICNANLEILDLVARWPGSVHDSTIFNSSSRRGMFEDGRHGDALLIGDSGYPLLKFLMTPLTSTEFRVHQLYNESLIWTRNCVERLIGVWKRRFPVLAIGCNLILKNIFPDIVATAVLHNILRSDGVAPEDDPELELPLPWPELIELGQIRVPPSSRRESDGVAVQNVLLSNYFQRL